MFIKTKCDYLNVEPELLDHHCTTAALPNLNECIKKSINHSVYSRVNMRDYKQTNRQQNDIFSIIRVRCKIFPILIFF